MTDLNICTVDNYFTRNISVCKPYSVIENTHIFNIKYTNNVFLIQTPVCVIPYSYSLYDNNSFKLDVVTDTSKIYTMLNKCCSYITEKIGKYNEEYVKDKHITEICCKVKDKYKLSLKNKDASNVYAFNSNEEQISLTTLHTFDRVICLFELKRLVIKNDKIFWQTNLVQIKKCSTIIQPSFSRCLITGNDTKIDDHDMFSKYSKMFQMKIPLEAIKHKMLMDGLTEVDFNSWSLYQNKSKPPPLPPPPPPPMPILSALSKPTTNISLASKKDGTPEFLRDISSGNFQLKKTKIHDVKQKILSTVNREFAPPSLHDIRNALSNLKKINNEAL